MKLHEYQSKQLFAEHGVPIPRGEVAETPAQVRAIAEQLGGSVAVKSQVLVGGRGKAGGIRLAKSPEEAEQLAAAILELEINGLPVRKVLVDEASEIVTEIYLGVTNDRTQGTPVIIASAEGGIEIEEVARDHPEKIVRAWVDPLIGLRDYQARNLAAAMELPRQHWGEFSRMARGLFDTYWSLDATLAEINPLVITREEKLLALDGKIVLDDNALYRHPELEELRDLDEEAPSEREARGHGLSYVKLDGNIGCLVNGAGLAMATMDVIKGLGGEPANFLDIGGGADAEKVAAAIQIILSDPDVHAMMFNIFGGITRCDEVARGILMALEEVSREVYLVTRLVGTNEELGRRILAEAKMDTASSLVEAAEMVIAASKVSVSE
ncbi:MAG: ADP-forming succinate--CoA ligase subunit beta [Chloroflexi bacterium]|nr:ADP-forming succinate--CoA ligase subunit beta [Chloroflexota bacterium]MDK1044371.1 ADP-forming succinate--CoA ligase subunit beta [Anaerolineales bacterium]MCH8340075.1 ADP-forming succinate--CoA ligase subunit beta [Chloroflexota bacterium]MCH8875302.1 ADP-forming succinate--CoA ligase subunit beta [Chloroflexota bacterium]MCI0772134.1 ADP-forming succinate--CoA ligase subunit beta [Chloroflexota bacterium]